MPKPELIYYVAQSLDGYITDQNDSVDWLKPYESGSEDFGYARFYEEVDSLVMGGGTFRFIRNFGTWPYPDKPSWIISLSETDKQHDNNHFSRESPSQTLAAIQNLGYRKTWLVGGGSLAKSFLEIDAISQYVLTIIPVILGCGLPTLANCDLRSDLVMVQKTVFEQGIIQLVYQPKTEI